MRENSKALAYLDTEKKDALNKLRNLETFDSDSIFADELLTAAAFAFLFDKKAFSDLRLDIKNFGIKNKDNCTDFFVDPRRDCLLTDENKNINVGVDSLSQLETRLRVS